MPRKKKDLTDSCDSKKEELSPENLNQQPLTRAETLNIEWGRHEFSDTWDDLKEATVAFAEASRSSYLSAPMAFPYTMRQALLSLLQVAKDELSAGQIVIRGKIIKRLGHYLKNQHDHIFDVDFQSAELWSKARQVIEQAKYVSSTRSYAEVWFDKVSANSLFDYADAAADKEQLNSHLLSPVPLRGRPTKFTPEQMLDKLIKKRNFRHEHIAAFWATRNKEPISIQQPARDVGITICDQKKGILKYRDGRRFRFSPNANGVWLVLRILVESNEKQVRLFKGWYGPFSAGEHRYTDIIQTLGKKGRKSTKSENEYLCSLK